MPADYGMDDEGFARYQIAEAAWMEESQRLFRQDIRTIVWGVVLGAALGPALVFWF